MSGLIIFGLVAVILFFAAFVTRRRIGASILGLGAGYILSMFWADELTGRLLQQSPDLDEIFIAGAVSTTIILLPALLLMLHGGVHKSMIQRTLAASSFTLVGLAFAVNQLQSMVVSGGVIEPFSDFLINYQGVIIALGVIGAVVDLVFTKIHKPSPPKGKH